MKKPTTPPKPDAAQLSRDNFSDALLGALVQAPEIDTTLRLAGIARHQLRRLMGDDEISAALETRRAVVDATPWRIEGYNDTPPMQHLNATLTKHLPSMVMALWDAVPMGFSVAEVVWAQTGAMVDIQRVALVPMQYFNPRSDGTLLATLPDVGYEMPVDMEYKFFHTVREQSFESPHGNAVLARLYWAWHFRQHGWRYWMQFMERFGMPIVAGQVTNPADFVDAMGRLGINTAIGVGTQDTVSVVSQTASGEFERLELALNKRIQKLILGQTLTSDVGSSGSFAAARVHDQVRMDRKMADLRLVTNTIQRMVNAFWRLNRYAGEPPTFIMEDGKGLEIERATRDAELVKNGIVKLTDAYLMTHYDFEAGDFTVPEAAPAAPAANKALSGTALQLAAGRARKFTEGQQVVEDLVELALADAPPLIDPKALRAAIAKAESPDDLAERLGAILSSQSASAFAAVIDKATYAAEVLGWNNAEKRRF